MPGNSIIGSYDIGSNNSRGQFFLKYNGEIYAFVYSSVGYTTAYQVEVPNDLPFDVPGGSGDQKLRVYKKYTSEGKDYWSDISGSGYLIPSVSSFGISYTVALAENVAYVVWAIIQEVGTNTYETVGLGQVKFDLDTNLWFDGSTKDYDIGFISKGIPSFGSGSREISLNLVYMGRNNELTGLPEFMLFFSGTPDGNPTVEAYGRVYYCIYTNGNFSNPVMLPGQSGSTVYWPINICPDAGYLFHFLIYANDCYNSGGRTYQNRAYVKHVCVDLEGTFYGNQTITDVYLTITPASVSNLVYRNSFLAFATYYYDSRDVQSVRIFYATVSDTPVWQNDILQSGVDTDIFSYPTFWWMGQYISLASSCYGVLCVSADQGTNLQIAEFSDPDQEWEWTCTWIFNTFLNPEYPWTVGRFKRVVGTPGNWGSPTTLLTAAVLHDPPAEADGFEAYGAYAFGEFSFVGNTNLTVNVSGSLNEWLDSLGTPSEFKFTIFDTLGGMSDSVRLPWLFLVRVADNMNIPGLRDGRGNSGVIGGGDTGNGPCPDPSVLPCASEWVTPVSPSTIGVGTWKDSK